MNVIPTFLLPNQISNDTVTTLTEEVDLTVGELALSVSAIEVLGGFEIFPEVCIPVVGCTPGLDFPGFSSPAINIDEGPLFVQTIAEIPFEDASVFDGNRLAWVLAGLNAPLGAGFQLNPNKPQVAVITTTGDSTLDEGQEGSWDALDSTNPSTDPDGDAMTFFWDFGDGTSTAGASVSHTYVDNGNYTLRLTVTDVHGLSQAVSTTTIPVSVGNLPPVVAAGNNKTVDEGTLVSLGTDLFGLNLVSNGGAEAGTSNWAATGGFATTTYRGSGPFIQIAAGFSHTCGLRGDGTVVCVGSNSLGQAVPPTGERFSQISAGNAHTCGIRSVGGSVVCWGFNNAGQSTVPTPAAFSQISAGFLNTCGILDADGTAVCWGSNFFGANSPPNSPPLTFSQIATNGGQTCGVRSDSGSVGLVECWGFNSQGQAKPYVADGGPVDNDTLFSQVAVGVIHTCGIRTVDSSVLCWGSNAQGQLNLPPAPAAFSQIGAGSTTTCGVRSDSSPVGLLECRGLFSNGVTPPAPPVGVYSQVSVGSDHACAVRLDGTTVCWGFDPSSSGQLQPFSSKTTFGELDSGFPVLTSPAGPNRGDSFFYGGGETPSRGTQLINVSEIASQIDAGAVQYNLSAFLGGSGGQSDESEVSAFFWQGPGASGFIGSDSIGPVTPAERAFQTGLLLRSASGTVPFGTRFIEVRISMSSLVLSGSRNDGYVDEASLVLIGTAEASFNDNGIIDTHTVTTDWGDLAPPVPENGAVNQAAGLGTVQATHIYGDNNTYTVQLTAKDDDHDTVGNGLGSDTFSVTVNNVPPVVTPEPATFVHNVSGTGLVATFTDPGFLDSHTAACATTAPIVNILCSVAEVDGHGQVFGTHQFSGLTGPFPQTVSIAVTVTADDGASAVVNSNVSVFALQIPSISINEPAAPAGGIEGTAISFTGVFGETIDPSNNNATVTGLDYERIWDFGDGSTDAAVAFATVGFTTDHTYDDNGVYLARLKVNARDGGVLVAQGETTVVVTVANVAPMATLSNNGPVSEAAPATISFSGQSDPSSPDRAAGFRYAYDCNNGPLATATYANGGTSASTQCTYDDDSSYTVRARIIDKDGGSTEYQTSVTVNNVAPTASLGNGGAVEEGSTGSVSFSSQFDPSVADTNAGFTYSYDFNNDGTFEIIDGASASATVPASFLDDGPGSRTVAARIKYTDGGLTGYTTTITIDNVAPTVDLNGLDNANEGGLRGYNYTSSDPGDDTFISATASCGANGTLSGGAFNTTTGVGSFDCTFPDGPPASSAVSVQVQDSDNANSNIDTITVSISNVAPTVVLSGPSSATEGDTNSYSFTSSDPGADTFSLVSQSCGLNGTLSAGAFVAATGTGSFDCTFPDGLANSIVSIQVADSDNANSNLDSISVTVSNVDPVVTGDDQTRPESSVVNLNVATFSDVGASDIHSGTIDWGDTPLVETMGEDILAAAIAGANVFPDSVVIQLAQSPLGDTNGDEVVNSDDVTVNFTDANGVVGPTDVEVRAVDARLGQITLDFNSPDEAPAAGDALSVDYTSVTLEAATITEPVQVVTSGEDILDLALVAAGIDPDSASIQLARHRIVDVTGDGVVDAADVTVNFGDDNLAVGPTQVAVVSVDANLGKITLDFNSPDEAPRAADTLTVGYTGVSGTVSGSHFYADDGIFDVTICVDDDNLGSDCDTLAVTVTNEAPEVEGDDDRIVDEGDGMDIQSDFTDMGIADTHTATIDWGDSTTEPQAGINLNVTPGTEGVETTGTVQASHIYADDGIFDVLVCVQDDDLFQGCNTFEVTVNNVDPDVVVDPISQNVQYSDNITSVLITATDHPGDSLSATITPPDGGTVPGGLALIGPNPQSNGTGTWTLQGVADLPAGSTVTVTVTDDNVNPGSTSVILFTVDPESARVSFGEDNPVAVRVAFDDGPSGEFSLTVVVKETLPDLADSLDPSPGNIGTAVVSMVLDPVGPGQKKTGVCTPDPTSGSGYDQELTVTCVFDEVGVNAYTVEASIGGNYYTGSGEDVLVVYDPSLGFATGGGWFYWPGTGDKTNFGFTMKYHTNSNNLKPQGNLLLIRHLAVASGDVEGYRVKSNKLDGLALGEEPGFGWASFSAKSNYKVLDSNDSEAEGNYTFVAYVEDHGEPGSDQVTPDRFWIEVRDPSGVLVGALSIPSPGDANAENLGGGNIQVPHN